jgi:hypothetical protein
LEKESVPAAGFRLFAELFARLELFIGLELFAGLELLVGLLAELIEALWDELFVGLNGGLFAELDGVLFTAMAAVLFGELTGVLFAGLTTGAVIPFCLSVNTFSRSRMVLASPGWIGLTHSSTETLTPLPVISAPLTPFRNWPPTTTSKLAPCCPPAG